MHVIRRRGWEIPERLATPEHLVLNRRALLAATGAAALSISPKIALAQRISDLPDPTKDLYPAHWDFTAGGLGKMTAAKWLGSENTDSLSGSLLFEPEGGNVSLLYKYDRSNGTNTAPGTGIIAGKTVRAVLESASTPGSQKSNRATKRAAAMRPFLFLEAPSPSGIIL